MSKWKLLTCAACGTRMHCSPTSLPQGQATCRACRKARPRPPCAIADCTNRARSCVTGSLCGKHYQKTTYQHRTRTVTHCVVCSAPLTANNVNVRHCSQECRAIKKALHDGTRGHRRRAHKYGVHYEYVSPRTIHERDGWMCGLCGKRVDKLLAHPHPMSASLDHIVPISCGGDHVAANLTCAHLACNVAKSNRGAGEQLALIG